MMFNNLPPMTQPGEQDVVEDAIRDWDDGLVSGNWLSQGIARLCRPHLTYPIPRNADP